MNTNDKILVGKIVAPQGLRGEFRIQSFARNPNDFKTFHIISDKFAPEQFHFVRVQNQKSNMVIAKIDTVSDRNGAENLRGTELFIMRSDLPELKQNEFYQHDLIGFIVVQNGTKIGIVDGFQNFGGGDIIELDNGNMVSFSGASVDITKKIVIVK